MCQHTILGSCTARLYRCGQDGIRFREFSLAALRLRSALALELAISAALAGDGITGDSTGTTTRSCITTTPTFPTAGRSSIAAISVVTPAISMGVQTREDLRARTTGSRRTPFSRARALVPSAALTTVA